MEEVGDDIASGLSSMEGGTEKTTESVDGDMNIFERAEGGKVSNISLPKNTREKAPGINTSVWFREKRYA